MRAIAICAALAGCGRPDTTARQRVPAAEPPGPAAPAAASPPGLRLTGDAVPLAYDLTLELDPDRASFTGHVAITIAIASPATRQLWLHAADLDIVHAAVRGAGGDEPARVLVGAGEEAGQLRGFALPRPVHGGTVTLVLDYSGRVAALGGPADLGENLGENEDEQGLFRERSGGRWYLYSQSESIFARRIVPCFDEPRFKPRWRVTAIVPRDQVALGNAPAAGERELPDGRREVRFAGSAARPSCLLAVAVGPFELVDAGRLGRGKLGVRIAVAAGEGSRAAAARRELPRIIDALEGYVRAPLPLAKLDLVAVPTFFGAMENPGLVTFQAAILAGDRDFLGVAAHELAHQWFGVSVTPAWWDHLWLSEAFASWLGERVATSLGAPRPPVVAHRARLRALDADDAIDAQPLVHPIARSQDIEPAFDAIAYEKGAAVLATFEHFVGPAAFQAAVRGYLAAHAGRSVTSQAFLDALATAAGADVAGALAANLRHAGTPVVELALRCDPARAAGAPAGTGGRSAGTPAAPGAATPGASSAATIVASARGGVTVPVCLRFATSADRTARTCFLAGPLAEHPLPGAVRCPAWVAGNDGGLGYYRTVWRGAAPVPPLGVLSPEERLARGDDAAIAVARGELGFSAALAELAALAATRDPYGELAALEIARAIDGMAADPARPAWQAWLASRLPDRLTRAALMNPRSLVEDVVRRRLVELARAAIDPAVIASARAELDRRPVAARDPVVLQIAAAHGGDALFEAQLGAALAGEGDAREAALQALGAFPAQFAPRLVEVLLDRRFRAGQVWPALAAMLSRGETRSAAWLAIHARFAEVVAALGGDAAREAIAALATLCDPGARAELAADAAPRIGAIRDGRRILDRSLATIDRCAWRRAAAGDLAGALATPPARRL